MAYGDYVGPDKPNKGAEGGACNRQHVPTDCMDLGPMSHFRRPGNQTRSVSPRGVCPSCGKRGLGNIKSRPLTDYRECRYCATRVTSGSPA